MGIEDHVGASLDKSVHQGAEVRVPGNQDSRGHVLVVAVGQHVNRKLDVHLLLTDVSPFADDPSLSHMHATKVLDSIEILLLEFHASFEVSRSFILLLNLVNAVVVKEL